MAKVSEIKPRGCPITFNIENILKLWKRLNQTQRQDQIPSVAAPWDTAEQLGCVFLLLFQSSMIKLWKHSTVIPITKAIKSLNHLCLMKAMERVIKRPHQRDRPFARPSSVCIPLRRRRWWHQGFHLRHHLEQPNTSARLLFADFSSAFNTLQHPDPLDNRLPHQQNAESIG